MSEPDTSDQVGPDVEPDSQAEAVGFTNIMLQFESLGQNCEFGLVQRHYQAEPLGLFRFSSAPLPKLLRALEQQLDGLGEQGSLTVGVSPTSQELMVEDQIYGFLYHAWVKAGEQTIEAVQNRELKRLPFLKRKLLQDLEFGKKVFVFHAMRPIPEEEVFPLVAILQCYGPNSLLFVTLRGPRSRRGYGREPLSGLHGRLPGPVCTAGQCGGCIFQSMGEHLRTGLPHTPSNHGN